MNRKKYSIIMICLIIAIFAACSSQQVTKINQPQQISTPVPTICSVTPIPYEQIDLPVDFQEKVYEHVKNITSFGVREAGSEAEASTIDYLINCLSQSGIEAKKEEFKFQYYNLKKVSINETEVNYDRIYINPTMNPELTGKGKIYNLFDEQRGEISIQKSSILYTVADALGDENIKAIIVVPDKDLKQLQYNTEFQVNIEGNTEEKTSYNVIAKISSAKSDAKDIIISAHMDSIFGAGADDNASGVGAVLELAKYYSSMKDELKYNIIFVFYGAEELGLVGSKAYISEHANELSNCVFVFNMDEIGGSNICIESAGGVQGDFFDLQSPDTNICAETNYEYKVWSKEPRNYCSMIPDWLLKNITDSCSELKYTFKSGSGLGSDHQTFAKYGIPATDITILGNTVNSSEDILDKVNLNSLLKAGQIVASVVNKTMMNYSEE